MKLILKQAGDTFHASSSAGEVIANITNVALLLFIYSPSFSPRETAGKIPDILF